MRSLSLPTLPMALKDELNPSGAPRPMVPVSIPFQPVTKGSLVLMQNVWQKTQFWISWDSLERPAACELVCVQRESCQAIASIQVGSTQLLQGRLLNRAPEKMHFATI